MEKQKHRKQKENHTKESQTKENQQKESQKEHSQKEQNQRDEKYKQAEKCDYLAVDIGASSGRHILGRMKNGRLELTEVYRFDNGMIHKNGRLCWDTEALFSHIKEGIRKCIEAKRVPVSMSVDTWGVDFVLLNGKGERIGDAVAYRDHRTDGMAEQVEQLASEVELYQRNGVKQQSFNTLYQLMALKKQGTELEAAARLLMTPDYYHYLLTGVQKSEYTIAATSQLTLPETREWDRELIAGLGLPEHVFGKLYLPGTTVGNFSEQIRKELGCDIRVVMTSGHDTASAVLAVPAKENPFLYISSGTWSLLGTERHEPEKTEAAMRAGLTNEGGYAGSICFLKNIMGLWMIQSVRKELPVKYTFDELCEMAEKSGYYCLVDVDDPRFLAPENMSRAIQQYAAEHGFRVPETPGELAATIYHSLADSYAATIRHLEDIEQRTYSCIHIVGGGANADYLNQLTANASGRRVCAGPTEATAIGNLLAQMLADGVFEDAAEARSCVAESFELKYFVPETLC